MQIKIILIAIILISFFTYCQSNNDNLLLRDSCLKNDNQFAITFSLGYLNSNSLGALTCFSPQINYQLNDNYQIKLLYRYGGGTGSYAFGEYRPEIENEIHSYNEISPLFILNLTDKNLTMYFGTGISVFWGHKLNNNNFNQFAIPLEIGLSLSLTEKVYGGIEFLSNFNSKTTFRGFALCISAKL